MIKKCDAKCDARYGADQHLWLRNNIFYYRVELSRQDGKRRYKRVSLHTSNFFEAREKIKQMINKSDNWPFNEIREIYNRLKFEEVSGAHSLPVGTVGLNIKNIFRKKKLSQNNNLDDVNKLILLSSYAEQQSSTNLAPEDRLLLQEIVAMRPMLQEFIEMVKTMQIKQVPSQSPSAPSRTIQEVLDIMLLKGNNCNAEKLRKKNVIISLLKEVRLTLNDDYSKFHNIDIISKMAQHIVNQTDIKGDMKQRRIRYIKELATCGSNVNPDFYKLNVVANLPKIEKTKKSERNPHLPYSGAQLREIFNPKHDYFKEHPDAFYVCLIAMFTGARINAAITLQYDDIIEKNGIPCINFRENHPIKQFKNEASERIVPIHPQLVKLGFVDYVCSRQKKLNAKGTDFIFPKCQTASGEYNNKYTIRYIFNFFKEIKVKTNPHDGFDFHSFRKNASIAMQDAHIPQTYINDIIGWEGKTTMEQSYSNHGLEQIYEQLCTFNYDFLKPEFDAWEKIAKRW